MTDRQDKRGAGGPFVRVREVTLRYGGKIALDSVSLDVPAGCITGLVGPDGVGKSSLLALIAGARGIQNGAVEALGGDMNDARHRREVCSRIAYMPQGLGRNLYPSLSVHDNIDFFGRLFGQDAAQREHRISALTQATGIHQFLDRPAGKLSGGMKQKLGLCCALIHDPDLLILDEPTTGVDPLSRKQFWDLVAAIRSARPGMSVLVATAYMEEAARFDWLATMNDGKILTSGRPADLLAGTGTATLEAAFVALLPKDKRAAHRQIEIPPYAGAPDGDPAIAAENLTARFGDFVAVDRVSFRIGRGEIFGFLGSNGCGKTTTMKMLTGLLAPSEGRAWLFGQEVNAHDLATRRRVGYMSQFFSLYTELTVRQNLELHARLFSVAAGEIAPRVAEMAARFDLTGELDLLPGALPLGRQQRLSLAVAMIHRPEMLILDEPTSGVDPMARDAFWTLLSELSRRDMVTIFVSTHFMNEAERCDRVALMHEGQVLVVDTPAGLRDRKGVDSVEAAFIAYLEDAAVKHGEGALVGEAAAFATGDHDPSAPTQTRRRFFDPRRMSSYMRREAQELRHDPIRLSLALVGCALLLLVMGYGISLDVERLSFAILDRDQSALSRDYALNIAGSRYFTERAQIADYADLDRRLQSGELTLAIEIPPGFARDAARGRRVEVGAWIDGAMPTRAETVRGYVVGLHAQWIAARARAAGQARNRVDLIKIETRFRYNPDVKSVVAMAPAIIPLLLMMIPAMLAALSVVREKELGSIINFYVTPTTRLEFLLGKQIPYVVLSMASFLLLSLLAVAVFEVPLKGSFLTLSVGALLYVFASTSIGLLVSSFMRSQIAAVFGVAVLTLLPAANFSGMIDPISSLSGAGRLIGEVFPTTYFLTIARGVFSKAVDFSSLQADFVALALTTPILLALSATFLRKQET